MVWNWKQNEQHRRIEKIAYEVYLNRVKFNQAGSAETDWELAKRIASSPLIRLNKLIGKSLKFVLLKVPRWLLYSFPQLEWTKLIAVPLILAAAGSIVSSQIQREANQISALNKYFDQLERLTFEQNLLSNNPNNGAIVIAQGRTVSSLRELDIERKRQLLAFLQTSGLLHSTESDQEPTISFKAANLIEMDLRGTDLTGANLALANLNSANLKDTFLVDSNLQRASLIDANLQSANLHRANLQGAYLANAQMQKANFTSANLQNTTLTDTQFQRANLRGASLLNADLTNAQLQDADLRGANLQRALMAHSNLRGALLVDAKLQVAFLTNANLREANLNGAQLQDADLRNAQLQGADLSDARLQGTNVTQQQLSQALLCRTVFPTDIDLDPNRDCDKLNQTVF